eukprot:jgi/Undpi1/585/HiC_scaffold_10.g04049.m1
MMARAVGHTMDGVNFLGLAAEEAVSDKKQQLHEVSEGVVAEELEGSGIVEEQRLSLKNQVEELEGKTAEREKHERERTLAIKYHKLKFFDRRKALRRLGQVHRKLKGDIDEDMRLELERTRQSEETDLKGKEGPPRAQKTHERLLKAALVRGEAAGWTEFQENLEKFVTGDRGRKTGTDIVAVEDAAAGRGRDKPGVKRTKGLDGLAVVAQEKLWGDEEEEEAGEGDGGLADGRTEGGGGSSTDGESGEEDNGSEKGEEEKAKMARPSGTPRETNATVNPTNWEERSKKRKKTPGLAPEGTGSIRSTKSDSEGELSGDEGFGAAASDEDDAYSFAEARMRWASGGAGGRSGTAAAAIVATTTGEDSSSDDGSSAGAKTTDGKTARGGLGGTGFADGRGVTSDDSQSDDSVGDIYSGARGKLPSDGGVDARHSSVEDEGLDSNSDTDNDSNKDSQAGGEGRGGGGNAAGGGGGKGKRSALPRESDGDDSSSGDDIDLNDDFFLEEKAPGSDDDGATESKNKSTNKRHRKRDDKRSAAGGDGRGKSGRGGGGRGGMDNDRGRKAGRGRSGGRGREGGEGQRGRGGRSYGSSGRTGAGRRGGGGGRGGDRTDRGGTGAGGAGGGIGRGWVPHGRGGGGRRGGFAGTGGVAGRASRGRGERGGRAEGGGDGSVRLNTKIRFEDD